MATNSTQNLNYFCSGHLVVDQHRNITFCNRYVATLSDLPVDELVNTPISQCFTKASNIFIDSYIYPLLLSESTVEESQMSWANQSGQAIPVVVNIALEKDGVSYWSIYTCANRDQLYTELITAKEKLEEQSKELHLLAITDPLTGLLNRRELLNQVKKITSQVSRNQSTFAVISIDIDFFKKINDTFGHQAGDRVLVALAEIMMEERRANDLVARIGGEEFVLLLPDIDEDNAFMLAERLRNKIEQKTIENMNITVSIGLIVAKKNNKADFETLLNLSDKALFDSKKAGRNRTTIAHHP